MKRSLDGDTDFFDIKAGVLLDILAPLLFIIILDYVLRTSVDKHSYLGFTLSERLSRRYPAKNALALTSDTVSNNMSSHLHHLENAAKDFGWSLC